MMTEDDARREATRLHNRIVAMLSVSDQEKVAEFLRETWHVGQKAGARPDPYTVTDVGVEGKRAWLMA